MSFLRAQNICLSLGLRDLLKDVNIHMGLSSRTALIGANGSGKSTLLSILSGERPSDSGSVLRAESLRLGYLKQGTMELKNTTPWDLALEGFSDLQKVLEKKQTEEQALDENLNPAATQALLESIHEKEEFLSREGWWERESETQKVLTGLGFRNIELHRPLEEFSGGWKLRAALAKALLARPEILLLDEPTNYLDFESKEWLLKFLMNIEAGILIVSHDRDFLDRLVTSTAEIHFGRLKVYAGNYSQYEEARAMELEQLNRQGVKQEKHAKKLEKFIGRFRYKSSKAAQVQSRIKELERIPDLEIPDHLKRIQIQIPPPPHSGKILLTAEDLTKNYGTHTVFSGLNLTIKTGEKIAVSGVNGSGKTTLLRILAGKDTNHLGSVLPGTGLKTGYFAQEYETLHTASLVKNYAKEHCPNRTEQEILNVLGAFLFSGDDLEKRVGVLSGGEKNRLVMATLLLGSYNLLVLDEPTNHLDLNSKEILLSALDEWEGTVVFVSHDRFFLMNLAQRVIALKQQKWLDYPGTWEEWENHEILQNQPSNIKHVLTAVGTSSSELIRRSTKELQAKNKKLQKEESLLLDEIEKKEKQLHEIQEEMSLPENYSVGGRIQSLQERLAETQSNLERLHLSWADCAEELEKLRLEINGEGQ